MRYFRINKKTAEQKELINFQKEEIINYFSTFGFIWISLIIVSTHLNSFAISFPSFDFSFFLKKIGNIL